MEQNPCEAISLLAGEERVFNESEVSLLLWQELVLMLSKMNPVHTA
jgi:hypothetical protein